MNVAAETQWHLMPPSTFADSRVVIGAVMEPAYEVGDDAFDYAIAGDGVHLAIYDAMGHDASVGLTSDLALAACRSHRRQGATLADIGQAIEKVLFHHFQDPYVTDVMADLDPRTAGVRSAVSGTYRLASFTLGVLELRVEELQGVGTGHGGHRRAGQPGQPR